MAKQTINLGTSPNKGDGDPLRTAFDKVNDNFDELYVDIKQIKSAQTGGGTLIVDTIGSVHATDSTLLVDGNNSKITGPISSTTWDVADDNIEITTTNTGVNANITLEAQGIVTLQESAAEDYVQVSSTGVVLYSNSDIALRTQGQDIHIGYDTQSGNVEMGHNSSTVNINGSLNVNAFTKLVPPSYTTAGRSGFTTEGFIVVNTTLGHVEAYVNGAWRKMTVDDVGELTDTGGVIPADLSDLTDTTNLIKTDVSQLADATNIIPANIGDLLPGGNTSDVLTKSAVGYAWTAPNYFGGAFTDLTSTPTTLAGYGITDAVALTGLSVTTASAGSAALSYNNLTGAFTFTPPDLSSYLTSYTETDPVVGAITGIVKADGAGNISAAVAGTDYLASVAFSDLTSTPTTIAGYGITDAVEDFADLGVTPTTISGYGITDAFDGAFSSLTSKPTTIAGYGITDAVEDFADLGTTPTTLAGYGITDAVASSGGNISLADDEKLIFGTDDDLEIFHNSSNGNTIISETNNNLVIKGSNLFLQSSGSENYFRGAANGAVTLYYDNVAKFNTSASGIQIEAGVEEKFATTNGATGVTALDCATGHVHYLTAPAGDITANFTNLNLTAEYATNVTVIIDQGNTEYEITAVQIGGAAQTIVWQGNSAPTGTANGVDSFSFTILNDGGTYVVLGQMVAFGGV